MRTIVNVNRHNVAWNEKHDDKRPVLSVKTYRSTDYGDTVIIYGADGKEAARLVYRPDSPLSCGARVWLETQNRVEIEGSQTSCEQGRVEPDGQGGPNEARTDPEAEARREEGDRAR